MYIHFFQLKGTEGREKEEGRKSGLASLEEDFLPKRR